MGDDRTEFISVIPVAINHFPHFITAWIMGILRSRTFAVEPQTQIRKIKIKIKIKRKIEENHGNLLLNIVRPGKQP